MAPSAWFGLSGQGHETTLQLVADELGVGLDDVTAQHSDTLGTPFGYGTYRSRSAAVGGVAVHMSIEKIKEKARRLAAHRLEAAEADIGYEGGKTYVRGAPARAKTIGELALAASVGDNLPKGMEPLLECLVPKAEFFPTFEASRTETPLPVNPLGVKGAGETGTIARRRRWSTRSSTPWRPSGSLAWTCR